jgi:hypothetical protein
MEMREETSNLTLAFTKDALIVSQNGKFQLLKYDDKQSSSMITDGVKVSIVSTEQPQTQQNQQTPQNPKTTITTILFELKEPNEAFTNDFVIKLMLHKQNFLQQQFALQLQHDRTMNSEYNTRLKRLEDTVREQHTEMTKLQTTTNKRAEEYKESDTNLKRLKSVLTDLEGIIR